MAARGSARGRRRRSWRGRPRSPRNRTFRKKRKSRPISRVLSWTTIPLGRTSPCGSSDQPGDDAGRAMVPLFGLAPGGVCRAGPLPDSRCALTAPFHPCLIHRRHRLCRAHRGAHARGDGVRALRHMAPMAIGGLLSVALSVGSRRPGVTWHLALWSPDFPRRSVERRGCLADSSCKCSGNVAARASSAYADRARVQRRRERHTSQPASTPAPNASSAARKWPMRDHTSAWPGSGKRTSA